MSVRVVHSSDKPRAERPGPVFTIGNFDGVHVGHRALLERTIALARTQGVPSGVLTFDPAPRDVLRPGNDIPRIQSLPDKLALLGELGIDVVVVQRFDLELAARPARWFADEILVKKLAVSGLVLGWDFCFGAKREGTVDLLASWLDVPVVKFDPVPFEGEIASSSRVRQLVRAGQVRDAGRLLARPHVVAGTVRPGDGRGRTLGFPTANLELETSLLPAFGVYAVQIDLGRGALAPGVANYGLRPTFGADRPLMEVHLLDAAEDLYGRRLRVHLIERLRDERKFDDVAELVAQIRSDIAAAREVLCPRTP